MLLLPVRNLCSGFTKELLVTCSIYTVFFGVGICRSYPSFLIVQLRNPDSAIRLTVNEESWIATLTILPAIFGSLFSGMLSDRIGRKLVIQIQFPICFIGWIIMGLAVNVHMLYAGMFLNGSVVGMCSVCTVYVAEISSSKNRGFMLSFVLIFFGAGIVACNLLSYYIGWKLSAFTFASLCSLFFIMSALLPESAVWLIGKGRVEEAFEVLTWLRDTPEQVAIELNDFQRANIVAAASDSSDVDKSTGLIRTGFKIMSSNWKQLTLGGLLFTFQQSSGFSPLLAFNASFFDELDIPIDVPTASLLYVGLFFAATFATPIINFRFGRRSTLMIGCCCCSVCFACVAVYETIYRGSDDKLPLSYCWLVLAFIYVAVVVGVNSVVSVPFIMMGEIYPNKARALLSGFSSLIGFCVTAVITKAFLYCLYRFGVISILSTYAVFSLAFFLFVLLVLPETKGKTLNEIQEQYFAK